MVSENSRAYCIVCPAESYGISQSLMAHLNKINNQKQKPKWYSQTTAKKHYLGLNLQPSRQQLVSDFQLSSIQDISETFGMNGRLLLAL